MYDTILPLKKILIILTTFYGQTYPQTDEVKLSNAKTIINQYVYFTQITLLFTTILLIVSFIPTLKKKSFYSFILPNVLIYQLIVFIIYWSLYFTAPVLILGKVGIKPQNYSFFIDLCQHVFPLIGLFTLFFEVPIEDNKKRYWINVIVAVVYTLILKLNKYRMGKYPYVFVEKMGNKILVFVFIPSVTLIFSGLLFGVIWMRNRYFKKEYDKNNSKKYSTSGSQNEETYESV
ncbi:hypothetical protein CDIK_2677 [Cucumispora dikerogammari]|nr:hypothetical protein CDIK_2677 [Cucumispora dikerogammari]